MPLVIAGGPSVNDYDREELTKLAKCAFTFAVNDVAFDFPCDVVVSIDPKMICKRKEQLQKLGKPIITRAWPFTEDCGKAMGLDIIPLTVCPDHKRDERYDAMIVNRFPLSGMLACFLSDALAKEAQGRESYVIGMDASIGHYVGHPEKNEGVKYLDEKRPLSKYEEMGLKNTINLSVHSNVSCWPKQSKLPQAWKVAVNGLYREIAIAWLRTKAAGKICERFL